MQYSSMSGLLKKYIAKDLELDLIPVKLAYKSTELSTLLLFLKNSKW